MSEQTEGPFMNRCELCGEVLPATEQMFKYHGYSGPCPKPPLSKPEPIDVPSMMRKAGFEGGVAQGVSSQQARIMELEAELEVRKKAWEELVEWVNSTWVQDGALGFKGALADKLTALEATLPKGGA